MKNTQTIKIQRKNYTLASDESAEYTENLAAELDRRISAKLSNNNGLSSLDAANLVAFDCMDEIYKANSNIENIRTRIKDYVDEAEKARKEREEISSQLEDAQRKINLLREKYAELFNEYKRLKSVLRGNNSSSTSSTSNTSNTANTSNNTNAQSEKSTEQPPQKPAEKETKNTAAPRTASDSGHKSNTNNSNFVGMTSYNPNKKGQA